jgi:hypothetical protein
VRAGVYGVLVMLAVRVLSALYMREQRGDVVERLTRPSKTKSPALENLTLMTRAQLRRSR